MSEEDQLRRKFLTEHSDDIKKNLYEETDIERVKTDDSFLNTYLLHNKFDIDRALSFLHTSLEWRKIFRVQELNGSSFPQTMHNSNTIFFYNTDKTNHKILHLQVVKMKKDQQYTDMAKRFLVWQIEQEFQANMGKRVVVLLDMCGSGLSNVDVNFIKFLISCFSTNYPYMLEYLLIVDLPWILNAVWQLVKKWLSAEQQKFVIVLKQHDLTNYIDKNQLFVHLGGKQEMPNIAITQEVFADIKPANGDLSGSLSSGNSSLHRRNTIEINRVNEKPSINQTTLMHPSMSESNILSNSPVSDTFLSSSSNQPQNDVKSSVKSVIVSPQDYLIYDQKNEMEDTSAIITVQNHSSTHVAFKVKTTNPDSYKVKPIIGIIKPKTSVKVSVILLAGKELNAMKDRFQLTLVMVRDETITSDMVAIGNLWKSAPLSPDDYADYRFSCKSMESPKKKIVHAPSVDSIKMNSNEEILAKLNSIQYSQYIIIIIVTAIFCKVFLL